MDLGSGSSGDIRVSGFDFFFMWGMFRYFSARLRRRPPKVTTDAHSARAQIF